MIDINLVPLVPELFLILCAVGLLMVGVFRGNEATPVICGAAIVGFLLTIVLMFGLSWDKSIILNGMFVFDRFSGFMKLLILLGLSFTMAISVRYLEDEGMARFEYPILVIIAGVGMMLMVSAHNLLALYMALELQSLALYVLAAFHRNSVKSAEAGIKYFILGALSSGMMLFGISLVYGYAGTLDFTFLNTLLANEEGIPLGVTFGLVFILAGLAFKISAVPFHMWTPDVYQGSPTATTALFAIVPKIAAMALLIRLLFEPFAEMQAEWSQIIYAVSMASMALGAFAAIAQDNIKRLLAYSSIGHMGYALIGVVAATSESIGAVSLYLLIYMVMSAGTFAIVLSLRRDGREIENISDMAGLSKSNPLMAYIMAIFMFSMSGIPPLAGFFGKLIVFEAAVAQELYTLAIFGVLASVVAAYYYLRIIKIMFFDDLVDAVEGDIPFTRRAVLLITALFVLLFVFKPDLFIQKTQGVAGVLFIG